MLLYFGGYTINVNRMAPKNSTELLDSIRIKNRSIKVKLEMFFLFVTLCNQNHEWKFYPRAVVYCCCNQASSNMGKIRFTRMANSFVRPLQNWARKMNVSFSAKKKESKLYFRWAKLYLHIYIGWLDKSHKLTLWTLTLNKEGAKKERENIGGGQECGSRGGEIVFMKERVATFVRS